MALRRRLAPYRRSRPAATTRTLCDGQPACPCFSASGLIESIAQTCAARMGYINKIMLKRDVQIGFIGAIRNLEVYALPKVGQRITIIVDVKEEVFGMTLASAVVKDSERVLVSTEIKIAVKQE